MAIVVVLFMSICSRVIKTIGASFTSCDRSVLPFHFVYNAVTIQISYFMQIRSKFKLFCVPRDLGAYVLVGTESHGHLVI
jgi:hypothetical protein